MLWPHNGDHAMSDLPDLKKLREVALAATPGPWHAGPNGKVWRRPVHDLYEYGGSVAGDSSVAQAFEGHHMWQNKFPQDANAEFIATFNPQTILALLDAYEASARDAETPVLDGIVYEIHRRAGKEWAADGYDFTVTISADEYKALCEEGSRFAARRATKGE